MIKSRYGGLNFQGRKREEGNHGNSGRRSRINMSGWWSDICELYGREGWDGMKVEMKREVGKRIQNFGLTCG